MISISYNIVWSSSYMTVFFPKIFFQTAFYTSNNSFKYSSPPRRSQWNKVSLNNSWTKILLRFISSKIWTVITERIEVGVPLLLKNRVNPLIHADAHALCEGTNSQQIPRVKGHVNKNIQAFYVLLPLYIFCTYKVLA